MNKFLLAVNLQINMNRITKNIIAVVLLWTCPFPAISATNTQKQENEKALSGQWECRNGVKKLYDTPLGAVYKIEPNQYSSSIFSFGSYGDNTSINSLQTSLKFNQKKVKIQPQFIVLDFYIRLFPAVERSGNPNLYFTVTRSNLPGKQINKITDLNGVSDFIGNKPICWGPIPTHSKYKMEIPFNPALALPLGQLYIPYYETVSCRMILNTNNSGISSVNVNGSWKDIRDRKENFTDKTPFQSIGIMIVARDDALLKLSPKKVKDPERANEDTVRTLLEISPITARMLNSEDELRELPPLQLTEYPYSGYSWDRARPKSTRNPDEIYGRAMKLINSGEDLVEGVKQLNEAAKSNHVFALYQLGICYYRGIGVEPDINEALRWLKRASEYNLPEAAALYGLLQIHRPTPTLHMSNVQKEYLKWCLNSFSMYYGKHENWIMAKMFFNNKGENPFDNYAASPKLELWTIANNLAGVYYRNNIPAHQEQGKTALSSIANPTLRDNYFRNVRNEPLVEDENFRDNSLELLVTEDQYPPAMLYRGRLLLAIQPFGGAFGPLSPTSLDKTKRTAEEALNEASRMFQDGAMRGNSECKTEEMFCLAQMKKLNVADFTPSLDLQLSDYPLYHILRYAVENPQAPGIKEFLNRKYSDARKVWSDNPTPWNNFLLGAETLYQFFDYGWDSAYYRIYWGDIKDVVTAFELLDKAAAAGIIPAQYLTGMQHIRKQRDLMQAEITGIKLLKAAAENGCIKAECQLVQYEFKTRTGVDKTWVERLKKARAADSPDAWFLTAEILTRAFAEQPAHRSEILEAYEKAAELGSTRAWYRMGMISYKNKDLKQAASYWSEFIKRDRQDRSQDIRDPYYEKLKKDYLGATGDKRYLKLRLITQEQIKFFEKY